MKRIEEIIDLIEITGDKCIILHKERGAFVVMKMDDYKGLVMFPGSQARVSKAEDQLSNNIANISGFLKQQGIIQRFNTDVREFEIPEEDRFYPEPLQD